jgi:hypothetical protein
MFPKRRFSGPKNEAPMSPMPPGAHSGIYALLHDSCKESSGLFCIGGKRLLVDTRKNLRLGSINKKSNELLIPTYRTSRALVCGKGAHLYYRPRPSKALFRRVHGQGLRVSRFHSK